MNNEINKLTDDEKKLIKRAFEMAFNRRAIELAEINDTFGQIFRKCGIDLRAEWNK